MNSSIHPRIHLIPLRIALLSLVHTLLFVYSAVGNHAHAQSRKTEHTLQLDTPIATLDAEPRVIDLQKLDWLVGRWVGTGLGGDCEEVFLPPWNGSMTGSFRYGSEGKLVFSEYFSLTQTPTGAVLKLKHFHPDMKSWEEKDATTDFEYVQMDDHSIWFDGLTYQLENPNRLNVWVAMKNSKTGEVSETSFVLHREIAGPSKTASEPSVMTATETFSTRAIEKEITVNCTKETAFRLWTTSEGVAKFFSPDSLIELFPGGAYEMYFGLDSDENGLRGSQGSKVLSLLHNELLIFDWPFPPSTPMLRNTGAKTHVLIQFADTDDGRCRVKLKQYGWQDGEEWDKGFAYFEKVWPAVLLQFRDACNK